MRETSRTGNFLEKVGQRAKWQDWYFGHFHRDFDYGNLGGRGNYTCLYRDMERIL